MVVRVRAKRVEFHALARIGVLRRFPLTRPLYSSKQWPITSRTSVHCRVRRFVEVFFLVRCRFGHSIVRSLSETVAFLLLCGFVIGVGVGILTLFPFLLLSQLHNRRGV